MSASGESGRSDFNLGVGPFTSRKTAEAKHSVEFYADDGQLLETLSRAIGSSLLAGDSAIVIATSDHLHRLTQLFAKRGLDVSWASQEGRFVSLDAAETLASFMVNGFPDKAKFLDRIEGVVARARFVAHGTRQRVVAFGEMVAILAAAGQMDAALRLEELWNWLGTKHDFHLHCAYPITLFANANDDEWVARICAAHHEVVPAESYTGLAIEKDRSVAVAVLQQKARALETEIQHRKEAQRALQQREAELRDFIENAVIPMHWVAVRRHHSMGEPG